MAIQHWSDKIWLVRLGDEPSLSEDLTSARDNATLAAAAPHVVVDLSGAPALNSTNLSQVLRLRKALVSRDRKLVLAAPNDAAWAVFSTTGLDKIFDFAPDVATALAGLQLNN